MVSHIVNDVSERKFRSPAQYFLDFADIRDAPLHIFKTRAIGTLIWGFGDRTLGAQGLNDLESQLFDGDLMVIADVEGLSDRYIGVDHGDDSANGVVNMTEAAGLLPGPVYRQGCVVESGLDKPGDDHPVVADLAGADGVEEADDAGL